MEKNNLFNNILINTPDDTKRFVKKSMDIADQVADLLKKKGLSQRAFAKKVGKSESEISKWLTGTHNFTLRSIAKIESILKEDVIVTPLYLDEYSGSYMKEPDIDLYSISKSAIKVSQTILADTGTNKKISNWTRFIEDNNSIPVIDDFIPSKIRIIEPSSKEANLYESNLLSAS